MKRRPFGFSLLALLYAQTVSGQSDFLPQWDAGYRGVIPDLPATVTVSAVEIETAGHQAIQEAIDSMEVPGALQLPEGVFELHGPIVLRSGVVLRGAGVRKTRLRFHPLPPEEFDGPFRPALGAIRFTGVFRETELPIRSGYEKGSTCLKIDEVGELAAGQMILVYSENDPDLLYTDERWNRPWAAQSLAQIVELVSVDRDKVTLDVPLRLTYKAELRPRVRIIDPIVESGLEDLTVENLDPECENLIGLEAARNCWVRRCETVKTTRGHIWINFSRFITVSGNEVHHSFNYGSGGKGYGIVAGNVATDCLITDNILHHLRHAMMAKRGSSGNVFSYNYSFERRRDPEGERLLCDVSLHGHYPYQNLFEGNVVEFIELADYWGPTGPQTTFVRNLVQTKISVQDHSHEAIFLGNRIIEGGIESDGTSMNLIFGGNMTENEVTLPSLIKDAPVPDSAYLSEPPENWDDLPWPVLSEYKFDSVSIPAQRRWLARGE